ncbi:BPI fold-containing family B member 3-like [Ahaetulla prasina]|uniref:BPI fold-containing family B member 3-like n=1 Tax=Ahaetulla prasina TaxID=499056 RepID=UPI00264A4AE6|nr:BPI fold-containing family B member 3-like [Ahaetulla prasina]
MLKASALLLLCGLLPICQGGAENLLSVAQVDKTVLENLLSNVLAKDDLLHGLTGGGSQNVLGGLNGGQNGGPLDGVLGGQDGGLLGDVLGGQDGGPFGGVLGGQDGGLLGGVLGGQDGGLLGGVLGGQDGGLLGGVLGGQDGGPLGGVLGQEGLLGLKLVDIILPKVTLKLFPVGLGLNIYTKIVLRGNTILGGALTLLVEVNITANAQLVQDRRGSPKLLLENCRTNLGGIRILSGLLPLSLDNVLSVLLNEVVPGLLCPVVDVVLNLLNALLGTVNSVCPFGILGRLHYTLAGLPLFKGQHIILNLNLMMTNHNGQPVDFPGAQNTSLPLPPAMDHTSQLMLPRDLLSSVFQMLVSKGGFNADLTELALRGSVPMTTSALQSVLPELSQLGAEDLPLVVKIGVRALPVVSLQNGKVQILLGADLQVLSHSNSSLTPLFTVNMNINLSGSFSVTRTKLGISLALESVSLSVSNVGSFDENALKTWITNILQIGYLPLINVRLDIGIPLPNIFNLNFADGVVKTFDEMVVINKTPK